MIKERYCSYEVSKLLKEKGFDEPCKAVYEEKILRINTLCDYYFNSELSFYVCAPTHQMAMDWLREIHKLHIEIYAKASGYRFIISKPGGDGTDLVCDIEGTNDGGAWDDYGECADSAMKYCLTELMKGGGKMKREIKFRGQSVLDGIWLYGCLLKIGSNYHILNSNDMYEDGHHVRQESDFPTWVDPNTVGQFTGLYDKDGKEIYEGDIVEYYEPDTYCINPDCEPHLIGYGTILRKRTEEVVYEDCTFGIDHDMYIESLAKCGLIEKDIEYFKEKIDEDEYFETNGFAIDKSILGIKVVGNIHTMKGDEG